MNLANMVRVIKLAQTESIDTVLSYQHHHRFFQLDHGKTVCRKVSHMYTLPQVLGYTVQASISTRAHCKSGIHKVNYKRPGIYLALRFYRRVLKAVKLFLIKYLLLFLQSKLHYTTLHKFVAQFDQFAQHFAIRMMYSINYPLNYTYWVECLHQGEFGVNTSYNISFTDLILQVGKEVEQTYI